MANSDVVSETVGPKEVFRKHSAKLTELIALTNDSVIKITNALHAESLIPADVKGSTLTTQGVSSKLKASKLVHVLEGQLDTTPDPNNYLTSICSVLRSQHDPGLTLLVDSILGELSIDLPINDESHVLLVMMDKDRMSSIAHQVVESKRATMRLLDEIMSQVKLNKDIKCLEETNEFYGSFRDMNNKSGEFFKAVESLLQSFEDSESLNAGVAIRCEDQYSAYKKAVETTETKAKRVATRCEELARKADDTKSDGIRSGMTSIFGRLAIFPSVPSSSTAEAFQNLVYSMAELGNTASKENDKTNRFRLFSACFAEMATQLKDFGEYAKYVIAILPLKEATSGMCGFVLPSSEELNKELSKRITDANEILTEYMECPDVD